MEDIANANIPREEEAPQVLKTIVHLPDGNEVEIREQNGNDEDILSKMIGSHDAAEHLSEYLAAIITGPKIYSKAQIHKWKSSSRYYLLLASRIHTFGSMLEFKHTFKIDGGKDREVSYEEDLSQYLVDFANYEEFTQKKGENLFKFAAKPHPAGSATEVEHTLSTGKVVKYQYANGETETLGVKAAISGKPQANDPFRFRNLQLKKGDNWSKVENFGVFSSREMAELRKHLNANDIEFELVMELEHPVTGEISYISPIQYEEFFFPS